MKTKLLKLMGVALTVVLLASLTVGLAGVPAGAATSNLKWTKMTLPVVEEWSDAVDFANSEGDYWATPGIDLGPIAQSPDGKVLFAAVADGPYWTSGWFHVMKSVDGGLTWVTTGFYATASGLTDTTDVVDIATSPTYGDDTTVVVATQEAVYVSDDAGKTFIQIIGGWSGTGTAIITDLDVALDEDDDLAMMVGTTDTATTGEVYVQKGLMPFTAQLIADDVLACAFLPTFGLDGDIGICAVVTDSGPSTTMKFSFSDTDAPDALDWGGSGITNAPITEAEGGDFGSAWARIAFPDDFDAFGVGNNVCFVGIASTAGLGAVTLPYEPMTAPPDGSDAYRVTCKDSGASHALDLDVRGVETTLLPTATAIISIDVCGEAEAATILVGTDCLNLNDTPTYFLTYISEDSGDSWAESTKQPTGGTRDGSTNIKTFRNARTRVLMGPDFCDNDTAYASTMGKFTDAFQRSSDSGDSWNQISIIDYGFADGSGYSVTDKGLAAAGFSTAGTARMITQFDNGLYHGAVWETTNSGKNWERIFSYANGGVTDQLRQIKMLGDGSAWFAVDYTNFHMWRTTDEGVYWKMIKLKPGMNTFAPVSATSFYVGIGGGDDNIYWTTRSGVGWKEPEDNDAAGLMIINFDLHGDKILIGTADGKVFVSDDGGETILKCGTNDPGGSWDVTVATSDLGFDGNNIIYAAMPVHFSAFPPPPPPTPLTDVGIWRTEVNWDDPADSKWVRIDDYQDSTGPERYSAENFTSAGPAISLPLSGILYAFDASPVDTDTTPADYAGGLWRSTNPTDDIDSAVPPYFERENKNLDEDDILGFLDLDLQPPPAFTPTFFCSVANHAGLDPIGSPNLTPYYEQIVMYTDTLNVGVPLVEPEADAVGVGLLPEGYVYPEVTLYWEDMAGATSYQYQVAIDAAFKTSIDVPKDGYTKSLASPSLELHPNQTYYWRVRIADTVPTTLLGAPLISPWSETFKFKTAIGASMARPDLQAPWPGEPDVPLSPTFEWSGIEWAEVYEYELAIDPTTTAGGYFATPLVALVGADSLVSTAWKCDTTLNYETRYYWHVKAIGVDTDTPWSDVGTFTTIGVAPPPPEPGGEIVIPPVQQITPAWIWAIVIIGAILVIAVVVLIVTTRRVP